MNFAPDLQEGYHDDTGEGVCVDRDECGDDEDVCRHGDCINTLGSYQCSCHQVQCTAHR